MQKLKKIPIIWGIMLILCLALPSPLVMAQTLPNSINLSEDRPFSAAEQQQIFQKLLSNSGSQLRRGSDRLRGLQAISDVEDKEDRFRLRRNRRRVQVTLINYNQGKAYRLLVDPNTGAIARQEELPGRPQSSKEERDEAKQIINQDPELSALITPEILVEGGFAVVPPANADPKHRYVQMHLVKPDRHSFLRVVTVDLTTRQIAAVVQPQ